MNSTLEQRAKRAAYMRERRKNPIHKSKDDARWKLYYAANKERLIKNRIAYDKKNPKSKIEIHKRWRLRHLEQISVRNKIWRSANREHVRIKSTAYIRNRRNTDPLYALVSRLRARIHVACRKQYGSKAHRTMKLVGCSVEVLRQWLESQFDEHMTWDNCGRYWVVDHVTPVIAFDLTQESEQLRAFHYTNCQPLEKRENIVKSDSMPDPRIVIEPNLERRVLEHAQRTPAPASALVGASQVSRFFR